MKTFKLFLMIIGLGLSSVLFNSCLSDDDGYSLGDFWIDLVTVVPIDDTTYYLRMDDGTTLWPAATNVPYYNPKEQQRAMVNFTILGDSTTTKDGYNYWIKVNRVDTVLTKAIAENIGEENDAVYGKDPVEIKGIWAGDNYLNVYFKAYFGGKKKHFVNLIPSTDEDAMFEFRHNAYDDPNPGYTQGGLVAFDLSSLSAENSDSENNIITVKVKTFEGDKIYEIKYTPMTKTSNVNAKSLDDVFQEGVK